MRYTDFVAHSHPWLWAAVVVYALVLVSSLLVLTWIRSLDESEGLFVSPDIHYSDAYVELFLRCSKVLVGLIAIDFYVGFFLSYPHSAIPIVKTIYMIEFNILTAVLIYPALRTFTFSSLRIKP